MSSNTKGANATQVNAPVEWSEEIKRVYTPIRPLGVGGFGSVWLARRNEKLEHEKSKLAAIKMIGGHNATSSTASYAMREISILSELSHPNIVHLVETFERDTKSGDKCSIKEQIIALSYVPGYTLEELLQYRGALGLHMAIEVSRQIIDAIAYLHGRAVIHRDIKPDNLIITGAKLDDEACWSDDPSIGLVQIQKGTWKVTLVDFGFARALHPDDLEEDIGFYNTIKNVPLNPASVNCLSVNDSPMMGGITLDASISRNTMLDLSSLGNRNYAAPELFKSLHKKDKSSSSSSVKKGINDDAHDNKAHKRESLTDYVSNYGLVADSFSVGVTMRYMLTGVPPHITVDEYVSSQNNVLAKMCGFIFSRKKDKKPKKHIRYNEELPKELSTLVLGLTHWDAKKRTTVRGAKAFMKNFYSVWFGNKAHAYSEEEKKEVDFEHGSLHHLNFVFSDPDPNE